MLVSALSVLDASNHDSACGSVKPCLVSGVAIRRATSDADADAVVLGSNASEETSSEVQVLNKVNQAISKESTPVIPHSDNTNDASPNPYVNYLLVHDISSLGSCVRNSAARPSSAKAAGAAGGTKQVASDWWKGGEALMQGSEGDVFVSDFDVDFKPMNSKSIAVSDVSKLSCTVFTAHTLTMQCIFVGADAFRRSRVLRPGLRR